MSREDFIAVAARLFSIYLLLGVIKHVPITVQLMTDGQGNGWTLPYIIVLLIGLLGCALLWFFPLTVARKFLPVMREPRSEKTLDASIAMSIGLTLIGIWVMAYALIDAAYWLTLFVKTRQTDGIRPYWSDEQIAGVVATAVQFIIATWLIFGNAGIKRLIYRYRYGALPDAS